MVSGRRQGKSAERKLFFFHLHTKNLCSIDTLTEEKVYTKEHIAEVNRSEPLTHKQQQQQQHSFLFTSSIACNLSGFKITLQKTLRIQLPQSVSHLIDQKLQVHDSLN